MDARKVHYYNTLDYMNPLEEHFEKEKIKDDMDMFKLIDELQKINFKPRRFCKFMFLIVGRGRPLWADLMIYCTFALYLVAIYFDNTWQVAIRNIFIAIPSIFLLLLVLCGLVAWLLNNGDLRRLARYNGITVKELENRINVKS